MVPGARNPKPSLRFATSLFRVAERKSGGFRNIWQIDFSAGNRCAHGNRFHSTAQVSVTDRQKRGLEHCLDKWLSSTPPRWASGHHNRLTPIRDTTELWKSGKLSGDAFG